MAKIKNVSGVDRHVPDLGNRLVLAGAVIEVPDADVYAYTCQEPIWAPADKAAKDAHAAATTIPDAEAPAEAPDPTEG